VASGAGCQCGLTPPSSGRQKGFAFLPPLMSNVSRHGRKHVARAAPSSAVAHCMCCSAELASSGQAQRAGVAVRPAAARAPSGTCCGRSATVALGCPSVGGQRTAVLGAARQHERVRVLRCIAKHERWPMHALGGLPRPCEYAAPALHPLFRHGRHRPCGPCRRLLGQRSSRANGRRAPWGCQRSAVCASMARNDG
jgi:hypothetical protein